MLRWHFIEALNGDRWAIVSILETKKWLKTGGCEN